MRKLLPALLLLGASLTHADFLAEVVPDPQGEPYHFTGRLFNYSSSGSGVVLGHERVAVTAAHVLYDDNSQEWSSNFNWRLRNESPSIQIRAIRYLSSYADLADTNGSNDRETFSKDMGMVIAYESLTDVGIPSISDNPHDSVTGPRSKMAVGFPRGLYEYYDPQRDQMHQTGPMTTRFQNLTDDYYIASGASTGPGASGGGLWVYDNNQWELSGIIVSGLVTTLGDEVNSAGITILGTEKRTLLAEAVDFASQIATPQLAEEVPATIEGQWGSDTVIRVPFFSIPQVDAAWEFADPRTEPRVFQPVDLFSLDDPLEPVVTGSETSLRIPGDNSFWNNKIFRVRLTNPLGSVSRETHFLYPGSNTPVINAQPRSIQLSGNADTVFTVSASGFPPPYIEWEVNLMGDSGFQPLKEIRPDFSNTDGPELRIGADAGFFSTSTFRAKVDNGFDAVYSEPARLEYTDLGELNLVVKSSPPGIIREGDTVVIDLGNASTSGGEIKFYFYDPFGRRKYSLPGTWSLDPDNPGKLVFTHDGAPLHDWRIETFYSGYFYQHLYQNPQMMGLSGNGPTFHLKAEGPPQLSSLLGVEMDSVRKGASLVPEWFALNPPTLEYQYSLDGEKSWHVLARTEGTSLNIGPALANANAFFRAKIAREDQAPLMTNPVTIPGAGQIRVDRPAHQAIVLPRGGYGIALLRDDLLAHSAIEEENATPEAESYIRIYEFDGAAWTLSGEILLVAEPYAGYGQLEFVNENRLLVANGFYSTESVYRCGGILEITREPGGEWELTNVILSPLPRENGFFAEDFRIDGDRLIVSERSRDGEPRVMVYSLQDGVFQWEADLAVDPSRSPYGKRLGLRGDWALAGTETFFQLHQRQPDGTWELKGNHQPNRHSADFLQPGGELDRLGSFFARDRAILDRWAYFENGGLALQESQSTSVAQGPEYLSPDLTDQNAYLNGIRTRYTDASGSEPYNVTLFRWDADIGQYLSIGIVPVGDYEAMGFDLSETTLAFLVRDKEENWNQYTGWEVWMLPLKEVGPGRPAAIPPWLEAKVVQEADLPSQLRLRYRQPNGATVPLSIQLSGDFGPWGTVSAPVSPVVIEPDTDGDGKVSLMEWRLPLPEGSAIQLYRAIRESD